MEQLEPVVAAIQYIEKNLTSGELNLDIVADAVHYSKFHLHRIFTSTVDLSIHDYIQRRRLTESAKLLVFSDQPIIDIAILIGYDSQQAFSNIFKTMYKQSPNRFRRHNAPRFRNRADRNKKRHCPGRTAGSMPQNLYSLLLYPQACGTPPI